MTVNSPRDFIPPEPFEGQNYKPRYARPSASLREELFVKLDTRSINQRQLSLMKTLNTKVLIIITTL